MTEFARNDAFLVEKSRGGDGAAFSALIRRYQSQVLATAYFYVRDPAMAEDLAQDAFIKAHQKLDTLNDPARFAGWLRTLVVRICLDFLRRKRPEPVEITDQAAPDALLGNPRQLEEELHREQTKRIVAQAVDGLSEKYREVVILHYFRDLTYREIADFLEVPVKTIDSRLRKAKILLSRKLAMLHEEAGVRE